MNIFTTKLYTACYNKEDESVVSNIEVIPTVLERVHNVDAQFNMALLIIKKVQQERASKINKN